jgi:hypothetical protein
MRRFLRENSLSLFFGLIFLGSLVAQSFAGWHQFNHLQVAVHLDPITWPRYVSSADFAVDVSENWQSEFLQFWLYLTATVWLLQKGSPESKELDQACRRWLTGLGSGRRLADPALLLLTRHRHGAHLRRLVAGPVGGRMGGLQREQTPAAAEPDHVGWLPERLGLLEPHVAELAERVPGGRGDGGAIRLPTAARLLTEQTGGRAA